MKGRCFLIRVADDFVMGCEWEDDARRILGVLPKRFARFKLTIHPQKTRLVQCQPPRHEDEGGRGDGTFDVLGLTHYWAKSRRGYWVIKRRTAKKRLRRALRAVWRWCRTHRHDPLREPYRQLRAKLRGHYQYDGIRGNYRKLEAFYRGVERAWRYWLSRRGGATNDPLGDVRHPTGGAGAAPTPYRAQHLMRPAGHPMFCIRVVPTL
jgi:RNA-directed DNA polymerase